MVLGRRVLRPQPEGVDRDALVRYPLVRQPVALSREFAPNGMVAPTETRAGRFLGREHHSAPFVQAETELRRGAARQLDAAQPHMRREPVVSVKHGRRRMDIKHTELARIEEARVGKRPASICCYDSCQGERKDGGGTMPAGERGTYLPSRGISS